MSAEPEDIFAGTPEQIATYIQDLRTELDQANKDLESLRMALDQVKTERDAYAAQDRRMSELQLRTERELREARARVQQLEGAIREHHEETTKIAVHYGPISERDRKLYSVLREDDDG